MFHPGTIAWVFSLSAMTAIPHAHTWCEFVLTDHNGRWDEKNRRHSFILSLEQAYNLANVTTEECSAWQNKVKANFVNIDFNGLTINKIVHEY